VIKELGGKGKAGRKATAHSQTWHAHFGM